MDDCFRWKLLAGFLAFLLAFMVFTAHIFVLELDHRDGAEKVYKKTICELWKEISERDGKNYICQLPTFYDPPHNIFMQTID